MRVLSVKYSRKISTFLLAISVLSGAFFYSVPANAAVNRGTYFLIENGSNVTVTLSNGTVISADDESTYQDGMLFAALDETQTFGIFVTDSSFKIHFTTTASQINFSLYSGPSDGDLDSSLQYYDLTLPINAVAEIQVTSSAVSKMKTDNDHNGTYETTPTTSYSKLSGTITDSDEPFLDYSQSGTTLTVDAEEATAVKNIYYSTAPRTGRLIGNASIYTQPLNLASLGLGFGDIIYFMAEDTVGNRSAWESYAVTGSTPTPTPTSGGGGGSTPTPTPTPQPIITPTPTPGGLQIPAPTPTPGSLSQLYVGKNINCGGTIYYVNQYTQKEGYPSSAVYFAWNSSFSDVQTLDPSTCAIFPDGGLTRLPPNSLVKVDGNKTVWKVDGGVAYPIATYDAMLRIQARPNIITVSIPYLHTYSGGSAIY